METRRLLKPIWAIAVIAMAVACSDEHVDPTIATSEQAAQKAQSIVAGQVTESKLDSTNQEWDVKVTTSSGAALKVEIIQSTGAIDKIEGTSGPFNYEVTPGLGLINFSAAKASAFKAMANTTDNIKFWELKKNDLGAWIYEFTFLKGQEIKVKINATNGEVVS